MEEYEYSFKVESIEPYINYCKNNDYTLVEKTKQNRVVYGNKHNCNIIARITTNINNENSVTTFDCKNISEEYTNLTISNESIPLEITDDNKNSIDSMIKVLDFKEKAVLNRIRYIYEKDGVKFEIDNYTSPIMQVVAIEGKRNRVDIVYAETTKLINNKID